MNAPVFDEIENSNNTGKIIPIYPLTFSLTQNTLRKIIENGLQKVQEQGGLPETLPDYILKEYKLENANKANYDIHFPKDFEDFKKARRRLVFEELLSTQLALLQLKNNNLTDKKGIKFNKNVKMSDVINTLPFKLTKAQLKVLQEIDENMESEKSMNRLLQGDVGSGKTVVAMITAYKAVKSGYQAAILAPTAILATQHMANFEKMLSQFDIKCELLISGISKKNKEYILERLKNGEIDILIGTHAMLEENVEFKNLGLVVTDEQHRFGVKQRTKIVQKGQNSDVLVMSATPIPRTLALILYGDLDISIIDELPPNRKTIETFAVTNRMEERINNFIKKQVDEGRQAYIVCPLVEESEAIEAKAATELVEELKLEYFSDLRVGLLHGKMKASEKDEIMKSFKNKEIDILVSTTVIEVGVNVPNATLMIIENAERFGLAQLHQLRGRVGRGSHKSYCILIYASKSDVCRQRMSIMEETNDGFKISEKDLEIRGPGEFFGTRQHGLPELKVANIFKHMKILKLAQQEARYIIGLDYKLQNNENKMLKREIMTKFEHSIKEISLN